MSMSTFISDLPGPQEEYLDYEDCDQERDQGYTQEYKQEYEHEYEQEYEQDRDVEEHFANEDTYVIKKKDKGFQFDVRDELNLENFLLFCILFIATLPQLNEMIRKVLGTFIGSGYSHGFITTIKCILLVILFIIVKKFVLV